MGLSDRTGFAKRLQDIHMLGSKPVLLPASGVLCYLRARVVMGGTRRHSQCDQHNGRRTEY